MSNRRLEIHQSLCDILECPDIGPECRCHFQPGSNVLLKYPAIVYKLRDVPTVYADNAPYLFVDTYDLTLMDKNPESVYAEMIKHLPKVRFVRFFVSSNINHWVFTIC